MLAALDRQCGNAVGLYQMSNLSSVRMRFGLRVAEQSQESRCDQLRMSKQIRGRQGRITASATVKRSGTAPMTTFIASIVAAMFAAGGRTR